MQMRIREIRESCGMTQKELADRIGSTQPAIANWESGSAVPRAGMLPAIANALGCTIDELFNYEWNSNNFTRI